MPLEIDNAVLKQSYEAMTSRFRQGEHSSMASQFVGEKGLDMRRERRERREEPEASLESLQERLAELKRDLAI